MSTVTPVTQRGPVLSRQFTQSYVGGVKRSRPVGTGTFSRQLLSTDTIGNYVLTLTNLVVGSAIQIDTQTGAHVTNRTAASTSEVFTLSTYGTGNPSNDLLVKVRKGTSTPYYKPYETLTTSVVGAQSIYVSQIQDE